MKITICGYHGFKNSGDEAILLAIRNSVRQIDENIQLTVLSNNPTHTKEEFQMDAVYRYDMRKVWNTIKTSDILLLGGGTLLQDLTSSRSLYYYLSVLMLAKIFKKKTILYANGVGDIRKKINRFFTNKIVNKVDVITLRDSESKKELDKLNIHKPEIKVTADPVFTLEGIGKEEGAHLLEEEGIPTEQLIGVCVREWFNPQGYLDPIVKVIKKIQKEQKVNIVLIPMHKSKDDKMMTYMRNNISDLYILKREYKPVQLIGILKNFDFIISMRLHTLIYSTIAQVPMIGLVYEGKVRYFLNQVEQIDAGDVGEFDEEELMKAVIGLQKHYEIYRENVTRNKEKLIDESEINTKILKKIIQEIQMKK